jgi:hypothetical protein
MKNTITNFLYWFESTLQLVLMKIITHKYHIDDIIFNSVFRSLTLPYYLYKLKKYNTKNEILVARWCDILTGILDQVDIILTYIAFAGLTIGEYITLRTLSVFFGGLYLIFYYKKLLPLQKLASICIILLACVILLSFYNKSNFFYSFICIISSLSYSLINFIIELNVKTEDEKKLSFYWTKTISYIIALFIGVISEFNYKTISLILNKHNVLNVIIILSLEFLISILENFYYYLKIKLITNYPKNGSLIAQFLDIARRFTLIIIGVLFFTEIYTSIIYVSLSLMFIGSILGLINFYDLKLFFNKYFNKSNQIVVLPNIEIICIDK